MIPLHWMGDRVLSYDLMVVWPRETCHEEGDNGDTTNPL